MALICLLVVASVQARAQPGGEEAAIYQEALQSLERGDKEGALARYNQLLEKVPNHAGAWLDLALLYCEQGEAGRAQRLFDHIEKQFAPPPAILELIQHYRRQGCQPQPQPFGRWTLSVNGGYTDNVNHGLSNPVIYLDPSVGAPEVRLSDQYRPRSSAHGGFGLNYTGNLAGWPGAQWFAGVTQRNFPSAREFDQRLLLAGVGQQRKWAGRTLEFQLAATHFSLHDQTHQVGLMAQAGAWALPPAPGRPWLGLEAALSRWRYPRDPSYDSTLIEGRVKWLWAVERVQIRGNLGPLLDRADGQRPGLDRRGYTLNLGGQWATSDRTLLDVNFRQRLLRDEAVYSPLFGDQKHRSLQRHLILAYQWKETPVAPVAWRLEWERFESCDNIPLFPYTSQTLTLSWQYQKDVF